MKQAKWNTSYEKVYYGRSEPIMESNVLAVGSLVYVTCYGPCWGLRGIVHAVDVIALADAPEEPVYFYLVALQEGHMKEPVWFVHDDVAGVEGDNVSQWRPRKKELSRVEIEALEIVANGFERDKDRGLEAL
jgi:hypothetical protein